MTATAFWNLTGSLAINISTFTILPARKATSPPRKVVQANMSSATSLHQFSGCPSRRTAAPSISTDVNPTTQVMVIASSALFRISKNFFIPSSTFH